MTQQANDIPKWIEGELFKEVFRQTQPKYQSTKNFRISHALAPGENYTTIILKVEAEVLLKGFLTFINFARYFLYIFFLIIFLQMV